ncbi:MAG: carboxypeptidase regulatory-like domain-containing protein [Candidatus Electryonea clarkiae]|nr:carboxypeptidase regulatory-like domain-containing protein [Candidatus Electryonea clarkiae]MDP8286154.1 carboxypeptidase regulatory-like domain-containing protein [Candidatus Electryonea clarkiae]
MKIGIVRFCLPVYATISLTASTSFAQIEFTQHTIAQNFVSAHEVHAIDMDGDNDIDVIGAAYTDDDITWWENNGNQVFTEHLIEGNFDGARSVHAADIDGDGDIDFFAAARNANDVAWWENDGDQDFTQHTIEGNFDGAAFLRSVDMDGDDDIDVVSAAVDVGDVLWWENDGDQDFTEHTVTDDFDYPVALDIADVDSDGDIDVLAAGQRANSITWWENDGDEDFTEHNIIDDFEGAYSVYAVDVDDDGDMDVIGTALLDDEVAWWENDGDEDFTMHLIADEIDGARYVVAADLDLDGDMDLTVAAAYANEILWWENNGDQEFTEHLVIENYTGASSVYVADVDLDGDIDILGTASGGNFVSWWENDLDPEPDATLAGTVTDGENGDPVEDAIVRAGVVRDTTDANGNYFIDNVLSGERTVIVTHPEYSRHIEEIEIEVGENTLNMELFPLSTVSGTVTDIDNGDAIEDAEIRFHTDETTTDENGEWELPPQEQGEHRVVINADHYYVFNEQVEVEPGENFFEFELIPLATISGTITDSETEAAVEDADIVFGDFLYTAISDENGDYSIEDVEAGEYEVTITTDGYFEFTDDIEVEERENEIDFSIDILSGDLTGIVSDALTQELLFEATVTVIDPETGEIYREALTDEDGEYTAEALHDGIRYLVFAELERYARSDTEEVLISWDRDNEQDFLLTPIYEWTIQQIQVGAWGDWVSTTGIVTQGTNVTDTEHTSIYIQDNSDWGILIYDDAPWEEDDIMRGDDVSVIGFVEEGNDITQITQFEIEVISNDNDLPDPLEESTGDMSGNSQREGTWGQITGQINRDPPEDGDYSLIVDDGSGQCEVRIIETTGIDLSEFSANDWGTFTGVIGLSRQGLRIIPNMDEDVARIAIDPPTDLTADQEVIQGDTLQLEVTLSWAHDHLDDWLRFKIYRDDEHIGNTQELSWTEIHVDPNPGEYESYSWIYSVTAVYDEGESEHSNEVEVVWDITSVNERPYSGIPTEWALEAVYPNPFNPELSIIIALPEQSELNVRIFNILGEQVVVIADEILLPGYKNFTFNASNLSSGIYLIHANVPGKMDEVRKVVLMR